MSHELVNGPMRLLRESAAHLIEKGVLHERLEHLLEEGLTIIEGCAYFSSELGQNPHLSRDEMGALPHQSLINKLHLEDYWDGATSASWDVWCIAQGVLLGRGVLTKAEAITDLPIDVVVTLDEGGALPPYADYSTVSFGPDSEDESEPSSTFRFYVHRDGDCWVGDADIQAKRDAVMILRR